MEKVNKSLNRAYVGVTLFFMLAAIAGVVLIPHDVFHGMFHPGVKAQRSGPVDVNKFLKALNIGG